ncbi:MAG: hypothetical protein ACPGGK_05415 [Pikeienuella sp.]
MAVRKDSETEFAQTKGGGFERVGTIAEDERPTGPNPATAQTVLARTAPALPALFIIGLFLLFTSALTAITQPLTIQQQLSLTEAGFWTERRVITDNLFKTIARQTERDIEAVQATNGATSSVLFPDSAVTISEPTKQIKVPDLPKGQPEQTTKNV